jgi:D-amino-acid dehydrogenase
MKTVIIGGGTIGLLSAYELRRRGREVVIIEKGEFAHGASLGNAGWITPSLSGPVPAPGLIAESIRWMLKPDSPLYISPAAVPGMLGWLLSFWRHCNKKAYQAGFTALAELNQRTMSDFEALQAAGMDFRLYREGLLFVGLGDATLSQLFAEFEELASYGLGEPIRFSRDETLAREPGLRPEIAGSVLMPEERHVRPESLNAAALDWLRNQDVELLSDTAVTGFSLENGKVAAVRTTSGTVEADQVLIATGAEAAALSRKLGARVPMQAGKGYSVTIDKPKLSVSGPMYMQEARVAVTPLDGALRVAGTMELSGVNNNLDRRRLTGLKNAASRFMNGWEQGERTVEWVGMRPMLPDGLPAIGRLPGSRNAFIASGHAMLGITLGPTTAAAIAELMNEEESAFNLKPYDPARFA